MTKDNLILISIFISILLFNSYTIIKNPDCPFHVDYGTYAKSISNFYEQNSIDGGVNGKFIYIYFMAILLSPYKYFGFNIYNGMVMVTGIFQILLVYLFYRCTRSILKTVLAATTLTFLTLLGHAETAIMGSVFLLLFFINRDKPYSEFFITIASFIRIDYAVYYLFARKKTAVVPIIITSLQWITRQYFFHSDLGSNQNIFFTVLTLFASYGIYFAVFLLFAKPKKSAAIDYIMLTVILLFITFFLKFPTQKVYFFPVLLSFILFDFKIKKKMLFCFVLPLVIINLAFAGYIQFNRINNCSPLAFYEFAKDNNSSVQYDIFQPHIDYYNHTIYSNYTHKITKNCTNSTDYFMAEDWRNAQILYLPYKFCLEGYFPFKFPIN